MVNKIKTNSTQGLYITEDEGGAVAADTPGEIDLANLAVGDTYVYFDTILRFEEKATFNDEGLDFFGFKTSSTGSTGDLKVQAITGEGMKVFYMCTVETDETTAENLKLLAAKNVIIGDGIKYLVKQTASEAFETFPNGAGVAKKVTAVIIRGYDIKEIGDKGEDVKIIDFVCERITERT